MLKIKRCFAWVLKSAQVTRLKLKEASITMTVSVRGDALALALFAAAGYVLWQYVTPPKVGAGWRPVDDPAGDKWWRDTLTWKPTILKEPEPQKPSAARPAAAKKPSAAGPSVTDAPQQTAVIDMSSWWPFGDDDDETEQQTESSAPAGYTDFRSRTNAARGIRNNNPGNVERAGYAWQGLAPNQTDSRFGVFVAVEYGIRAMARDLMTGYGRGEDTIREIITQYAPHNENDTNAYIKSVEQSTGWDAGRKLNLHRDAELAKLIRAMIAVETGRDHSLVTDRMIKTGIKLER